MYKTINKRLINVKQIKKEIKMNKITFKNGYNPQSKENYENIVKHLVKIVKEYEVKNDDAAIKIR